MMRILVVTLAFAVVFSGSAQQAFLSAESSESGPAPAPGPAPGPGKYDLDAFATERHEEWRHGDYPDYKQTHTKTWQFNPAQNWEDSQSDQKSSKAKWH